MHWVASSVFALGMDGGSRSGSGKPGWGAKKNPQKRPGPGRAGEERRGIKGPRRIRGPRGGPSTSAFYTPLLPGLERGPGGSQGPVGVAEPLVLRSEDMLRIRADVKSPSKPRSLTLLQYCLWFPGVRTGPIMIIFMVARWEASPVGMLSL